MIVQKLISSITQYKFKQNLYHQYDHDQMIQLRGKQFQFYDYIKTLIIFLMSEEQVQQLKAKLQAQQQEFENYKVQCKQLEEFLESQSQKKQEQIRKLKEQSIKKQKNYGLLKTQVGQLQSENAALKAQLNQIKGQQSNSKPVVDKSPEYLKQIQQLKQKVQSLTSECGNYKSKIQALQSKEQPKSAKIKPQGGGDNKKLEEALSNSKSKIAELERQNQKLREELKDINKKSPVKEGKDGKDNKQQQRLLQKIGKLQKKLSQSQSQTHKAEQNSIKLSKQIKELKNKLMSSEMQKQSLSKKVQKLIASSSIKREVMKQKNDDEQNQYLEQEKQISNAGSPNIFSALFLTKKHYVSPFLQVRNDNTMKILKSTKNGSFQRSLGSIKYRLNDVSYNSEQLLQNIARIAKQDLTNGIKSSIILFGPKKTTKKYLLATIITKLKDFLLEKVSQSQQQIQASFIKASPDPEKKVQLKGQTKQQLEEMLNKIIEMAQKSPKKPQNGKVKAAPKPKARCFKLSQGQLYIQIITTSFTNIPLRETISPAQALNNIAYSRLPNALQPTDCRRQIILILNPIVSLYDECKNALSLTNCKKSQVTESNQYDLKSSQIKQDYLNDAVKKRMESFQRQIQQQTIKNRRHQEDINFYKSKFQELQLRLKGLLNTHRQQNNYLKKSPVTLSYEKMLKFVHSVQSKNPSFSKTTLEAEGNKYHQSAYDGGDADEGEGEVDHEYHDDGDEGQEIL